MFLGAPDAPLLCSLHLQDKVSKEMCPWYDEGPSLFDILDGMEPQDRNENSPFRMPILDKHKDMGTMILGEECLAEVSCDRLSVGGTECLCENKHAQ